MHHVVLAPFQAFSPQHYAALAATVLLILVMSLAARLKLTTFARTLEVTLAVLLLIQWPLHFWYYSVTGTLNPDRMYPCHLCDLAAVLSGLALLTHRRGFCELVYFWGLAGTLQGLITPALETGYPSPRYFLFFLAHGGVVATALYGVIGLKIIPEAAAKWRAWFLINVYAVVIGLFNWAVGTNYGFLCRKPDTASLYDVLGPWPWYVVASSFVALIAFLIFDLPFMFMRRKS